MIDSADEKHRGENVISKGEEHHERKEPTG